MYGDNHSVMGAHYQPLRKGQIRLLRPVQIMPGKYVHMEMTTFHRTSAPKYAAVSYTWGEEGETEAIQLNGRQFPVRRNLWSCLHYLGLNARHSEAKYLWVDAICIDQANTQERNDQVLVMDEIYKNACYVSMWLGLDPRLEDDVVRDIARYHGVHGPVKAFEMGNFIWGDHATRLADHEYWSRYWVIQECLLARDIQVHCGPNVTPWPDFRDALEMTGDVNLLLQPEDGEFTKALDSKKYGALPLLLARPWDDAGFRTRPLDELLIHHRHSRCRDPRDRVFALLGLLPREERACLENFLPNYTLTVDHVVTIALAHVREINHVRVTTGSDKLFDGLGVDSRERRARLIRAADEFPYFYDMGGETSAAVREDRARNIKFMPGFESLQDEIVDGDGLGGSDDHWPEEFDDERRETGGCIML